VKLSFKLSDCLEWVPADQDTLNYTAGRKEGDVVSFDIADKKRTNTQNGCLHQYMGELSTALNDGGYDVGTTITVKVDFTPETVKEYMVKPIVRAMYPNKIKTDQKGREVVSTTQLSTKEISLVYENLNRLTAEKFGISIPWPSRFNH